MKSVLYDIFLICKRGFLREQMDALCEAGGCFFSGIRVVKGFIAGKLVYSWYDTFWNGRQSHSRTSYFQTLHCRARLFTGFSLTLHSLIKLL